MDLICELFGTDDGWSTSPDQGLFVSLRNWIPACPRGSVLLAKILFPVLACLCKRFPRLARLLAYLVSIVWWISQDLRGIRDKIFKWVMSLCMASVTIPGADHELQRHFQPLLKLKTEQTPSIRGLRIPSYKKCQYWAMAMLFAPSGRHLVAKNAPRSIEGGKTTDYEVAPEHWQVFLEKIPNEENSTQINATQEYSTDNDTTDTKLTSINTGDKYKMFVITRTEPDSKLSKTPRIGDYCSSCSVHYSECQCQSQDQSGWGLVERIDPTFEVWCFGWSPKPIRDLIDQIGQRQEQKKMVEVTKAVHGQWRVTDAVDPRAMESIYLDPNLQQRLIDDVEEYIDEDTAEWYKARTIPYRRGYLLYGRPGCGKTSWVHALAAKFNLRLNVLTLSQPGLDDSMLAILFSKMTRGDIILLEDVDCAGISLIRDPTPQNLSKDFSTRPRWSSGSDSASSSDLNDDSSDRESHTALKSAKHPGSSIEEHSKSTPVPEIEAKNKARRQGKSTHNSKTESKSKSKSKYRRGLESTSKEFKTRTSQPTPVKPPGVSLSALLNAIDGVSAPQGHILIMTTNHKEKLDEALIRAGRVDIQVEFTLATKEQACQLFKFMYQPASSKRQPKYNINEIPQLATDFARRIPEKQLSCAQLQTYVVQYKTQPKEAVKNVEAWVKAMLAHKAKGVTPHEENGGRGQMGKVMTLDSSECH